MMSAMLHVLYLVGVSAFAASGVLAAYRANMDPFGGLVLAFAASISGGTLRDLILNRQPLYWTHDWVLLTVIICVGVSTMVYLRFWSLPRKALLVVDAIGLAVVTVIGARAAIEADATPLAVIILAVLTGVTGEVIRDVLCGSSPAAAARGRVRHRRAGRRLLLSGPGPPRHRGHPRRRDLGGGGLRTPDGRGLPGAAPAASAATAPAAGPQGHRLTRPGACFYLPGSACLLPVYSQVSKRSSSCCPEILSASAMNCEISAFP